jgi:hypothetical protein
VDVSVTYLLFGSISYSGYFTLKEKSISGEWMVEIHFHFIISYFKYNTVQPVPGIVLHGNIITNFQKVVIYFTINFKNTLW